MKKIKEFSKKYLIGFVIGLILFSIVGVKATTYFPSNQTTYNNDATGMGATNVQTALDELYNTCFPPTAGDSILDSVTIVTVGDGLYKDEYEDRYFYRGKNPNNYITFNNETWRIVSIESDGTIKIIRNESIGDRVWDSSNSNNWVRPSSLNTYLNGTYLTSTLNSAAQSQIVAKDWSIGPVTWANNDLKGQINDENSQKWNGKVALITMSEYIRSNNNQSNCKTLLQNQNNPSDCTNTTWMFNNDYWWTLSSHVDNSSRVFAIYPSGYGPNSHGAMNTTTAIRPSVYLSSDIKITGGNGSSSSPYQIK